MSDMQWKELPGSDRSPRATWLRRLAILTGLAVAITGVVVAVMFMDTPAILLEHAAPSPAGPISPYAATHTATGSLTSTRTGTWLEIPALRIELPVHEGDGSNAIPDWVALHYPGTSAPGQDGNSYLYAHGIWGMFGALLFAKNGEAVMVHDYTTGSITTLHISRVVGRVAYNDSSWIHEFSSGPLLTLQTCVGANIDTDRWIVQAT